MPVIQCKMKEVYLFTNSGGQIDIVNSSLIDFLFVSLSVLGTSGSSSSLDGGVDFVSTNTVFFL